MKQKLRVLSLLLLFFTAGLAVNAQMLASNEEIQGRGYGDKNVKLLKHALIELENRFKVSIAYRTDLVDSKKVDLKSTRFANLESALEYLLKDSNLEYKKMKDDVYVISEKVEPQSSLRSLEKRTFNTEDFSQASTERSSSLENLSKRSFTLSSVALDKDVSGKVTSENGEGIPGVNVIVKGSTIGTTTDVEGNFKLTVPDNAVLVFSYVGFTTQEIEVGAQSSINVSMATDVKSLSEVVVIGYGEKSRRMLTESIGTVESKELNVLPVAAPDAAMQGRISGVQITNTDGTPGGSSAVRIRGVGSVGTVTPLYVVDGIPLYQDDDPNGFRNNPLSTINPNDIESISVLKDASSAAVYGVRAAHGVILITTKRGKTGKPKFGFDAFYGVQNFPKKLDVLSTQEVVALNQEAITNKNNQLGLIPGAEGYEVLNPDLTNPDILAKNTDWQSAAIRKNAPIQSYNLSVSGGNETSNYFISGGFFNQAATIQKYDLDRYNLRANSDHRVGGKFRFGQTFNVTYQEINFGENGGGNGFLYSEATSMPPYYDIYDVDKAIPGNRYGYSGNLGRGGFNVLNPIANNALINATERNVRLIGGIYGELEIIKGLKFKSAINGDFVTGRNNRWQPAFTAAEVGLDRSENQYGQSRNEVFTKVYTNTLTYQKSLGEHTVNALAGIEFQESAGNSLSYTGFNFLSTDPGFYSSPKNGQGKTGGGNQYENATSGIGKRAWLGYFGRISYDFKQKYLFTATLRNDHTSSFAPENRSAFFPSVSAAWRISDEAFFANVPIINDLKLRASWGQLGSDRTAAFPHVFRSSTTPDYGSGEATLQAPSPVAITNKDITWERVETTDFGFDMSLFDNKVNFLATYYYKITRDFLFDLPISATSGFPISPVNAGSVSNQGIELELGYNTSIGNDFKFNVSGNLTTIKNRLESLAEGVQQFTANEFYRTGIGYPIGYFYGYETAGLYQNAEQVANALEDATGNNAQRGPGDVIFVDNNSLAADDAPKGQQFSGVPDGRITPADRTYLGKTIPDFFYGLNLGGSFKGLDVSIFFQGVSGTQVFNSFRRDRETIGGPGRNLVPSTLERWTSEGSSNSMPRAIAGDPNDNNRFSDRWIEDAGFLRLKNVQIGYTLPRSLLDVTRAFSNVRIYVSGTNLLTFTEYTGLDPEVVSFRGAENQRESATDKANIPQPRTVQAGLQLQF